MQADLQGGRAPYVGYIIRLSRGQPPLKACVYTTALLASHTTECKGSHRVSLLNMASECRYGKRRYYLELRQASQLPPSLCRNFQLM
eukprot:685086-Amphidinium_carterae.1